jgi:hypothetical protein
MKNPAHETIRNALRGSARMVINALRRDAEGGKPARGEMADTFEKDLNDLFEVLEEMEDVGVL